MDLIKSIDEAFLFEKNKIRIFGNFDKPLFVAKDICDVLGLSNITEALKHIPEKWMGSLPVKTLNRGTQTMIFLHEPAVYQLIMRSNRPNALRSKFGKDFDDKIEEEIRILNEIPMENKESKINYYTKDELQKIVSFLKIGRKYNDTKDILCAKILFFK